MLRGINKQDIFFNEDDFLRMMSILHDIPYLKDEATGAVTADRCSIYAYCILHNHIHILIREGRQSIAEIMKIIEVSYVGYYNKKYQRVGHLFQGRFKSEPVNDDAYFHTVLRYIALNPVKAMEAQVPEEYPYSYWNEYVGHPSNIMKVIKPSCIKAVLKKYPLDELIEWIHQTNDDKCLDMDDFFSIKSDAEAWDVLSDSCGIDNPEDFRTLDPQTQLYYLMDALHHGINISQASRLGTVTRYQIIKAYNKKCGTNSAEGSDPAAEKSVEQTASEIGAEDRTITYNTEKELLAVQEKIRHITGLGKKTYHQLHLLVEYLWRHPESRCAEIASFLKLSNESTRRHLVLLANENIVTPFGDKKNRVYTLKNVE